MNCYNKKYNLTKKKQKMNKILMKRQQECTQYKELKINRYEIEQNAVFIDYKIENILQKIDNYKIQKYHVKLSLAKNLKSIQEIMGSQYQSKFGQFLEMLSKELQDVQLELIKFIKIKRPFAELGAHYRDVIMMSLKNMANGPFLQIKQESCKLISELAHNFPQKQVDEIMKFANKLIQSENEQNKIVAIQLFASLATNLSQTKREQIFEKQYLSIFEKSSVRVKKQIILQLGKLSQNLGIQYVDKKIIKNFYIKQTKDNAWGIRKACIQVITQFISKSKQTKLQLTNILLNLLKDCNRFVRIAAYNAVPKFIAKYGDTNVPKALFDIYLSLVDCESNSQVSKPEEVIEKVSFYFPGVLQTVGVQKWPELSVLFNKLLRNKNQAVKRPLADSFHKISKIIGINNSKQYLFSSLDYILRENMDKIKQCVITNISEFVSQFQNQTKQNLIDIFLVLQKDPKKWRIRYLIANQLKQLSQLYSVQIVFKYLLPISLKLCNDNVSEVRRAAALQIPFVINHLKIQQNLYNMAIESILGYAQSEKYLQRQTFCLMIQNFFQKQKQFYPKFGKVIYELSKDPIILVKISLAISLINIINKQPLQYKNLQIYIRRLCQDIEIKQYFQSINSILFNHHQLII